MQIQAHVFRPADLVGGHVVLDLVNTVTARDGEPIDWLDSYQRVLEWAALTEEFDEDVLAELAQLNTAMPRGGASALRRLRELRETIHGVLAPIVRNEAIPEYALDPLDAFWRQAVSRASITLSQRRAHLEVADESSKLDYLNHALALRAIDRLRTLPLDRTRICAGRHCGWLFIDRSKGGRRRWCDMATCGNAAKSRRHHQRKHDARQSATGSAAT